MKEDIVSVKIGIAEVVPTPTLRLPTVVTVPRRKYIAVIATLSCQNVKAIVTNRFVTSVSCALIVVTMYVYVAIASTIAKIGTCVRVIMSDLVIDSFRLFDLN